MKELELNKSMKMIVIPWRKYRSIILCSIVSFYLGCGLTSSFLKTDCTGYSVKNNEKSHYHEKIQYRKMPVDYDNMNHVEQSNEYSDVQYVVLILSAVNNTVHRNTIRNTWMKLAGNLIIGYSEIHYRWRISSNYGIIQKPNFTQFFFAVGTRYLTKEQTDLIESESKEHKDMLLLGDVSDSYKSLTEKLVQALEWISQNVKNFKFLIKCDDDSFVRIDLLVRDLGIIISGSESPDFMEYISYKINGNRYSPKNFYMGYFDGRAPVKLKGKWEEPDWFLCDKYLPYALGGGYVISKDIVGFIGRNHNMLSRYNSEDVSMGVWTAALRDIVRIHDVRFDTQWISRGCKNNMLVRHKQTSADMVQMYENLVRTKGEIICSTEVQNRSQYMYDWSGLPSKCCK